MNLHEMLTNLGVIFLVFQQCNLVGVKMEVQFRGVLVVFLGILVDKEKGSAAGFRRWSPSRWSAAWRRESSGLPTGPGGHQGDGGPGGYPGDGGHEGFSKWRISWRISGWGRISGRRKFSGRRRISWYLEEAFREHRWDVWSRSWWKCSCMAWWFGGATRICSCRGVAAAARVVRVRSGTAFGRRLDDHDRSFPQRYEVLRVAGALYRVWLGLEPMERLRLNPVSPQAFQAPPWPPPLRARAGPQRFASENLSDSLRELAWNDVL